MKFKLLSLFVVIALLSSCGGDDSSKKSTKSTTPPKSMVKKVEKKEEAKPVATDAMSNKGVGPITSITLGDIDPKMVKEGEKVYKEKCTACHKPKEKFIGPAQFGVIERRSPEWIMNMILNPEVMIKKDPIAMALLKKFNGVPMTNQNLTKDQARSVLEYFRTLK